MNGPFCNRHGHAAAPLGFIPLTLTCHSLAVERISIKADSLRSYGGASERTRKALCERFLVSRLMDDWLDLMDATLVDRSHQQRQI